MRIAIATTEFLTEKIFDGGLANYVYRVANAMISFEHEPIVFVASTKNEVFFYENIKVIRVNQRQYTWWFWLLNCITLFRFNPALLFLLRSFRVKKAISDYNKSSKIDIVQYTNSMSLGILSPLNIPCVIRISSYQKLIDSAYGYKRTFRLWQKQYLQDIMLKRAVNIFGPSEKIGNYIGQKFNKSIEIIESPFLLDISKTDDAVVDEILNFTSGNPYLLYFGSLTVLKGVIDISDILFEFFEKYPSHYFVFVGKTIDFKGKSINEILKEKAGKHSGRVLWYNSLGHKFLYPVIKNAQFVVLPSRIDNFPNTCIEAMAMGKIVIGTIETSFEQLIDDKVSGILCKPANSESLMNAVNYVMKLNENEKLNMGNNAIARIDKLKPEFVVKKLLDYYDVVIEKFNSKL